MHRRTWAALSIATLLLYTLAGFFLVPRLIRNQIRDQARATLNRDARVQDVRFNPFTLAATITGLTLADRDGTALFAVDLLRADLQVSGLFRRALRFREIRVEHPVVAARILADGKPSIADLMEPKPGPSVPFQPPRLIVDRLTVNGGVVQFADASRQPTYQFRFEPLNLDVRDLITIPQEEGSHTITIGIGEGAELKWTGQQTVEPLRFSGRFEIVGLDLRRLWDYAGRGQALDLTSGRADVTLPYEISRGADQQIQISLKGAAATIRALSVRPRDEMVEWLSLPELRVQNVNAQWPAARVDVERVQISKPLALVRIERDGELNWARVLPPADPVAPVNAARPVDFRLASFDVEDASVTFEDRSAEPAANGGSPVNTVKLDVTGLTASARGISSNTAAPVPFSAKGRVQEKGTVEVDGTIAPSPLAANVTFGAQALDLLSLGPYITRFVPGGKIGSGTAALQGKIALSTPSGTSSAKPTLKVTANGSLDDVELRDLKDERVVAWGKLGIDGLTFDDPPNRARVRKVTLDRPFAKILIDQNGRLNLTSLTAGAAPVAGAPVAAASAGAPAPALEVVTVEIRDASAEFSDQSILLPFQAQIHSANGTIRDVSSVSAAPATLAIEGRIDQTGYVKADGTLRLADPLASSEIAVAFRSIEMPDLTPYFAEFAGYRVREGALDVDIRYVVKDRRLVGSNKIMARDLALGDKVDSSKAPPLPVRLAIALLKDRDGRINIDVPIEGTVDSPEWSYKKVFWAAVRTIMGNLVKAPFRALGRLFGRDEDDLELVEFDPGRSDLLPAEQATLARLAEQIAPRQDVTLTVEGRFDPEADVAAMKRAKLETLIESRRDAAATAAAATGASTLETILEALFTEQFSAEALQGERARFTTAPATPAPAPAPAP
ncbi:MAG: DUF748 domain-containing protein, partial [Vicinamibacterales bacterium]